MAKLLAFLRSVCLLRFVTHFVQFARSSPNLPNSPDRRPRRPFVNQFGLSTRPSTVSFSGKRGSCQTDNQQIKASAEVLTPRVVSTEAMEADGDGNGIDTDNGNGSAAPNRQPENGDARAPPGRCLSSFVDDGSTESHRYFLSRRTVLEMLRDRGYSVAISEINLSLQEFREMYGQEPDVERLKLSVTNKFNPSKRILVFFFGPGPVKVNAIKGIAYQIVNKDSLTGLILIVQSHITSPALKALDLFSFKVEIFRITDLLVNITKHVLKPKHRVLTDQEKERLLKKFSLDEKQLPRLLKTDAVARYYGLEKGQVVKIVYSGDITGSYITYRCVW